MRRHVGLVCAAALWAFTLSARADPLHVPGEPAVAPHARPTVEPAPNETAPADARGPCAQLANNPFDETSAPGPVVDLNTADESALLELPGIGPARARAIVAYRSARGGFRSVSQLLQIRGIGRALLRQLRPLVTLSTLDQHLRSERPQASPP